VPRFQAFVCDKSPFAVWGLFSRGRQRIELLHTSTDPPPRFLILEEPRSRDFPDFFDIESSSHYFEELSGPVILAHFRGGSFPEKSRLRGEKFFAFRGGGLFAPLGKFSRIRRGGLRDAVDFRCVALGALSVSRVEILVQI
jgi:hypothetical protein